MAKTLGCLPTTDEIDELKDKFASRFWRLNNLYWILDDQGERVKFKLNAVQYALYTALWWLNVVLKSRQHGITTFCAIFFLDACVFNSNVRAGIVCHRLDDAKRIFRDKIKYAFENLPEDIRDANAAVKDDACELALSNNSSIYIGVSMRSGTLQYLHVSEYGWLCAHAAQKAREIKSGTLETVHKNGIIIIEATAEGKGNDFEDICIVAEANKGKELTRLDYRFHFFPWYIKPENTLEDALVVINKDMQEYFERIETITGDKIGLPHRRWYIKKKLTLGGDIYKEHPSTSEEAFMGAVEGAYFKHEMIRVKEENRIGFFPWERGAKVFTFWDKGSIHTAIWFMQFLGGEIRCIDFYYDATGQGTVEHAKVLDEKRYLYAEHWTGWDMDPDSGSNRKNQTSGKYIIDEARALGIDFKVLAKYPFKDRVEAGRMILDKCRFNEETTKIGVAALFNFRQSVNRAMSTEDRTVFNNNPEPGPQNHIADAFTHAALAYLKTLIVDGKAMGQTMQVIPRGHTKSPYRNDNLTRSLRRPA